MIYLIQFTLQFITQSMLMLHFCVDKILLEEQETLFNPSRSVMF